MTTFTLRITDLASGAGRLIDFPLTDETLERGLMNFVLSLNGNGMSAKGTANAMVDMDCIRSGTLPFTRNGVRFEKDNETACPEVHPIGEHS